MVLSAIYGIAGERKENKMRRIRDLISRKPKVRIVEDHNWMKPECKMGCPYFVDGQAEDSKDKLSQCIRPFGERCLAERMLVQMAVRKRQF